MSVIIKTVGILCVLGYVTGLFMNFTDTGQTGKVIRLIIVMFVISAVIFPVSNMPQPDFEYDGYDVIKSDSEDYVIKRAEVEIENIISDRMSEKNISYTTVDVHINKQTGNLQVDGVELYGINENSKSRVYIILADIAEQEKINFGA